MQWKSNIRQLAVESLENRSLLAGNVLASVDAFGLLTVTGDDAANRIYIRQLPASGSTTTWPGARYLIEAYESWNTTTINGQSSAVVEGVKNVNISMNDGADALYAVSPNRPNQLTKLPGTVNVDMGSGMQIGYGDGLTLWVENHGQMNINLGTGRDGLTMWHSRLYQLNVLGDPVFHAGDPPVPSGDDTITLYDVTAGGAVSIDTKYGNDKVTWFGATTRASATATINTGSGNDNVFAAGEFKSALRIDSGDGNDYVQGRGMNSPLTINTGRGNDEVQISGSGSDTVYEKLAVWLGEGDDHLDLVSVRSLKSILSGADGADTLETHQDLPSDLGDETISGFEIFEQH